jgi:uncharacterized Zn finger protein
MSWYYYPDAKEAKERIKREITKRQKKGEPFKVLDAPSGNTKLVKTFWGKAWNKNLESYRDYEYRLPRGRSYLRQGNVYNLTIQPGEVTAVVAGSELYDVSVTISPLEKAHWESIKSQCEGQVASMLDLLGGKLGDGVLKIIADHDMGLFPKPKEIRFSCSCPDHAEMCKHVAATLYGVGVKLDTQPDLFFVLRSVDPAELISTTTLTAPATTDGALEGEDLSALFGIEMEAPSEAMPPVKKKPGRKKKAAK